MMPMIPIHPVLHLLSLRDSPKYTDTKTNLPGATLFQLRNTTAARSMHNVYHLERNWRVPVYASFSAIPTAFICLAFLEANGITSDGNRFSSRLLILQSRFHFIAGPIFLSSPNPSGKQRTALPSNVRLSEQREGATRSI